jgi:hypothetical protein
MRAGFKYSPYVGMLGGGEKDGMEEKEWGEED